MVLSHKLIFLGGRIIVFASTISQLGFGSVASHDDPKLYNTSSETKLLSPASTHYQDLSETCINKRICVDLFFALTPL